MNDLSVVGRITGDVSQGGWSAAGTLFNDGDSFVINQELSIAFDDGDAILQPAFLGHAVPGDLSIEVQGSVIGIDSTTAQEFMKKDKVQGIFFAENATPANLHQITDMNLANILEHIVDFHCNLSMTNYDEGIILHNIDTTNSVGLDDWEVKEGRFWQRLTEIAFADTYVLFFDKENVLQYTPHPMFLTHPPPILNLTESDMMEPLTITPNYRTIGQVKIFGRDSEGFQLEAKFPTSIGQGEVIERSGVIARNATFLTRLATQIFKFESRANTIIVKLGGSIGLNLELMDLITITYARAVDGINFVATEFWIHKIDVAFQENFNSVTTLTLQQDNSA